MTENLNIPKTMQVYPFFKENSEIIQYDETNRDTIPFFKVLQNPLVLPDDLEKEISQLFLKWKKTEVQLTEVYEIRNKTEIRPKMVSMIANYLTILFWMNGKHPLNLQSIALEIDSLKKKPINCKERILFILSKPELFHSFIQLRELYIELEKQFALQCALNTYKK